MFSLQLSKTSLRFQLADVPTGAPVDDREETIADTHAALSKLLADCKKYVGAVVASCVMVGGASMAQEAPQKNNIPVGTVATQPIGKNAEITIQVVDPSKGVIQEYEIVSSSSATLQATNGYGQIVEFNGEKISVAELQAKIGAMSPEERTKAINSMSETTADIYETYMDSVKPLIIAEKEKALNVAAVAINNNQAKLQVEQTKDQEEKTIDTRIQTANQKIIKEVTILVNRVEKNESLLKNNEVVKNLQEVYDKPELLSTNESLLSKIQALIIKAEKYHVRVGG